MMRSQRVVDKVFHVVQNGQRLSTLADLCHHDPDLNFDDHQLDDDDGASQMGTWCEPVTPLRYSISSGKRT